MGVTLFKPSPANSLPPAPPGSFGFFCAQHEIGAKFKLGPDPKACGGGLARARAAASLQLTSSQSDEAFARLRVAIVPVCSVCWLPQRRRRRPTTPGAAQLTTSKLPARRTALHLPITTCGPPPWPLLQPPQAPPPPPPPPQALMRQSASIGRPKMTFACPLELSRRPLCTQSICAWSTMVGPSPAPPSKPPPGERAQERRTLIKAAAGARVHKEVRTCACAHSMPPACPHY